MNQRPKVTPPDK